MPPRRRSTGGGLNASRIELNYRGIHDLLHSEGVRKDLKDRGNRVADTARQNPAVTRHGINVVVTETPPGAGHRPHVYVKLDDEAGRAVEARHRVLGSAVDAARD